MTTPDAKTALFENARRTVLARLAPVAAGGRVVIREPVASVWDLGTDDDRRGSFRKNPALTREFLELLRTQYRLRFVEVRLGRHVLDSLSVPPPNSGKDARTATDNGSDVRQWDIVEFDAGVSYKFVLLFHPSAKLREAREAARGNQ